jgi:hypothetical protein
MTTVSETQEVQIICPVCKKNKLINIPEKIINQARQLTTISIQKGLICNHHFQAFIDKNFRIRGYQKIDFEINPKAENKDLLSNKKVQEKYNDDKKLFQNLTLEGNYVEFTPQVIKNMGRNSKKKVSLSENGPMSLEEIYEEFWDLIDDDNIEFKKLIFNDKRRKSFRREFSNIELL